jgi:hypothetical protein
MMLKTAAQCTQPDHKLLHLLVQENKKKKGKCDANKNHKSKIASKKQVKRSKITSCKFDNLYPIHNTKSILQLLWEMQQKGCTDMVKWMQMKHTHPPISVASSPWKTNLCGSASLRWHSFDWNCKSIKSDRIFGCHIICEPLLNIMS